MGHKFHVYASPEEVNDRNKMDAHAVNKFYRYYECNTIFPTAAFRREIWMDVFVLEKLKLVLKLRLSSSC